MWGAIAGDIIGSLYEHAPIKDTEFPLFVEGSRFTDDTVMTVGTAEALLGDGDYARAYQALGRRYPRAGYGRSFKAWIWSDAPRPYGSWGNGAPMRVSPIGWFFEEEEEVLREAARSAAVTHNHPEGVRGAQAIAFAVWLARKGASRAELRREMEGRFHYELSRPLDEIRSSYRFDVSSQGTVPPALLAFLESADYESAVRLAVSLGGDSDTLAAIAGSVAEAFYGEVPREIRKQAAAKLAGDLRDITERFEARVHRGQGSLSTPEGRGSRRTMR